MVPFPVSSETLQPPDGHRFVLNPDDAQDLALILLGTHTAAYGGKGIAFLQDADRILEVSIFNGFDETGYVDSHGATGHTSGLLALDASLGLGQRHFRRKCIDYR